MMLQNNLVFALPANLNEPAKSGTAKRHKNWKAKSPARPILLPVVNFIRAVQWLKTAAVKKFPNGMN